MPARDFVRLFVVIAMFCSACAGTMVPSSLLIGNWSNTFPKAAMMEMRLREASGRVTGTACGWAHHVYLSFSDAVVDVDGKEIRFQVLKSGQYFKGELKDNGTIEGQLFGGDRPANVTFNRSDVKSGTCAGAIRID